MKYTVIVILLGVAFQLFAACKSANPVIGISTGDTSENALDWEGTYSGVIPCADCEGIQTEIWIGKNQNYLLKTKYLGKSEKFIAQEGDFEWNKKGNTIQLSGMESGSGQYLVGENRLFHLDQNGKRIEGELSENYVLKKKMEQIDDDPLASKTWVLTELMGKEINGTEAGIFIEFGSEGSRINGFGGCNQFFGNYELESGNQIKLLKIGRTQKFCPGSSETEDRLFTALENVDNFFLSGNILTFNKAKMAPLMRWEFQGI